MKIDRIKAEKVFRDYVSAYNAQDDKVGLKIEHTFRVAVLCEKIAASLGMAEDERDLAWFTGLLHDVGRFEQLRNYGTFIDAESIDHAMYGRRFFLMMGKSGIIRRIPARMGSFVPWSVSTTLTVSRRGWMKGRRGFAISCGMRIKSIF
ncbi:MAG: HD domain-containing protein [Eisenbergiella massiliensis]